MRPVWHVMRYLVLVMQISLHRSDFQSSLRVALPSPWGETGERERLRKAGTNRVMWRQGNLCKYVNKLYFPRKNVCTRAVGMSSRKQTKKVL